MNYKITVFEDNKVSPLNYLSGNEIQSLESIILTYHSGKMDLPYFINDEETSYGALYDVDEKHMEKYENKKIHVNPPQYGVNPWGKVEILFEKDDSIININKIDSTKTSMSDKVKSKKKDIDKSPENEIEVIEKSKLKKTTTKNSSEKPKSKKTESVSEDGKDKVEKPKSKKTESVTDEGKDKVEKPKSKKTESVFEEGKDKVEKPKSKKTESVTDEDKNKVEKPKSKKSESVTDEDKDKVEKSKSKKTESVSEDGKDKVEKPKSKKTESVSEEVVKEEKDNITSVFSNTDSSQKKIRKCSNCKEIGHDIRKCPMISK